MAELALGHITKRFGDVTAVDDVTLDVHDGELVALLGPSGCGKTTILRLIAGFESVSAGEISFDGELMSAVTRHVSPERRRVGIVFQSYALWPHMSVGANVGYPLRVAKVNSEEYRSKVDAALETVGLAGLESRRPADLSGGQRQRVALARCLVMEPSLVLLDEPLANLDVHLRAAMEDEFVDFHDKTGATMLYITHDQAEAMALADRVAVMDDGCLVQVTDPHTLYDEPATAMVADFIGRGVVIPGLVTRADGHGSCEVEVCGERVELRCTRQQPPGPANISLRPECLDLAPSGIEGRVRRVVYRGGIHDVEVFLPRSPQHSLLLNCAEAPSLGATVHIRMRGGWVIPG
jgi:iron(III) transport system ATP-binding protein